MDISSDTFKFISQHFCFEYPNEGCGLLLKDGSFVPSKNVAVDPSKNFEVEDEVWDAHAENVAAVLHSHSLAEPVGQSLYNPITPSGNDLLGHIASGVPWGITLCDGENIEPFIFLGESHLTPLYGREFIHGYFDCYSACRDWYRVERGLDLPDFARDPDWWCDADKNLYLDNFAKAGFHTIDEADAKVGDAILFRVASRQVNHAGVIVGDGQVFHHLFGRLSCDESYNKYRKGIIAFLRHKDLNQ